MWIAPERHGLRHWLVPALAACVGLAVAITAALRGHTSAGLIALAVLIGYAAHLAYRRGEGGLAISESFGTGHRARGHLKAAAMTGDVLIAAIVCAVIIQVLRNAPIGPYAWLAGIAGVTYALSVTVAGGGM
ncbi:ABC transporter permease [Actinomadura scrupuli]|uniref:ABC transporter permease n=1 Tax=Actinomadura scrupuli TaxID=559629 RepID=UPI003D9866B9